MIGRELDQLLRSVMAYKPDHAVGNIDEVSDVSRSWHACRKPIVIVSLVEVSRSAASTLVVYNIGTTPEC